MRRYIFGALLLLLLSACAGGMSRNECASADWRAYGIEDGAAGRSLAALNDRAAECARFGLPVDAAAYERGIEQGLNLFCTPSRARQLGFSFEPYRQQCVGRNEAAFLAAYEEGREEGLDFFCRPANGLQLGRRGVYYDGRCGGRNEGAFLAAYEAGRVIRFAEQEVFDARRRLARAENLVDRAYELRAELQVLDPDSLDFAKTQRRLAEIEDEAFRAERFDLPEARGALRAAERALAFAEGRAAAFGGSPY
jgi:hypothetical protein